MERAARDRRVACSAPVKSMNKEIDHLETGNAKRTRLGLALEESAKEILAHVKGETKLPTRRVPLPDEVERGLRRQRSEG